MTSLNVPVKVLPHGESYPLPQYATPGSAGLDLIAAIEEDITLEPGERTLVPTALTMALPEGYEAQVRGRSGLAAKHGVTVLNAPGTIDADYRGEIKVILINLGQETFTLTPGMRCAQLVIAPVTQAVLQKVSDLPTEGSVRLAGGFGSTGT